MKLKKKKSASPADERYARETIFVQNPTRALECLEALDGLLLEKDLDGHMDSDESTLLLNLRGYLRGCEDYFRNKAEEDKILKDTRPKIPKPLNVTKAYASKWFVGVDDVDIKKLVAAFPLDMFLAVGEAVAKDESRESLMAVKVETGRMTATCGKVLHCLQNKITWVKDDELLLKPQHFRDLRVPKEQREEAMVALMSAKNGLSAVVVYQHKMVSHSYVKPLRLKYPDFEAVLNVASDAYFRGKFCPSRMDKGTAFCSAVSGKGMSIYSFYTQKDRPHGASFLEVHNEENGSGLSCVMSVRENK